MYTSCTYVVLLVTYSPPLRITTALHKVQYLAVSSSSSSEGAPRESIIPRFIFAGSNAQFDRPMKATREKLSSVSMMSSLVLSLSSNRGCNVLRGIFGESSASPTSSRTTTDAKLSEIVSAFLRSWSSLHCWKVVTIPSEVDWGLHW